MAAVSSEPQWVSICINDIEIQVPKGELIVESVKRLGLEIPIFCYHSRMKPVGMCRMCLVDVGFRQPDGSVRMMPKPQAGCTLPADSNMVVFTDSEQVRKDRKGVLEFLLINHPLDCPICDRGGECPLQNNTLFYGPSTSRYVEIKRHLPKAFPLSKYVTLDLERCIQCGRCVRFTEEISGDSQLAFLFRGAEMQPSTFGLSDFSSKFSGNVIEICPVGALTSREYRFRARPWDLETKPAICIECSNGCNVWFDYRAGQMVRINGRQNESVNEEWTCDKGKFGHNYLNSTARLTSPMVRDGDKIREGSWAEAYGQILAVFPENASAGLTSAKCSNEDLYIWKKLFEEHFRCNDLDYRWTKNLPKESDFVEKRHGIKIVNSSIASIEKERTIFVFGGNLAEDQPIVFLRARKAWSKFGAKVVVATSSPTEVDDFAVISLIFKSGTECEFISGLRSLIDGVSENIEELVQITGVTSEKLVEAANVLRDGFATISSRNLYGLDNGLQVVDELAKLCKADNRKLNVYSMRANSEGACRLGMGHGKNTQEILEGCANGSINALWLNCCDPFELWHDNELVRNALERVEFLVVQDIEKSAATEYASVVLPITSHSEQDGSYTNCEGRVQWMDAITPQKGSARPGWKTASELILRLTGSTPHFNAKEVLSEIVRNSLEFGSLNIEELSGEGCLLGDKKMVAVT